MLDKNKDKKGKDETWERRYEVSPHSISSTLSGMKLRF